MPTRTFESYTPFEGEADFPSSPGFLASISWEGEAGLTVETPAAQTMIVLARRSEFSPATGDPEAWKPAEGYGFGTKRLGRELGLGELLSYERMKTAEWAAVANACGVTLFGGTLDEVEAVSVTCVVSLLSEEDEPATGDEFTTEGRTFTIVSVNLINEVGAERYMAMRGMRVAALTRKKVREGHFNAPSISTTP